MKMFLLIGLIAMFLTASATTYAVAQDYKRVGNTFVIQSNSRSGGEPEKTELTVTKDGKEYPIFITKTGRCFILKVSKNTGKEYKQYLGEKIAREVCKELNRTYVEKVKPTSNAE